MSPLKIWRKKHQTIERIHRIHTQNSTSCILYILSGRLPSAYTHFYTKSTRAHITCVWDLRFICYEIFVYNMESEFPANSFKSVCWYFFMMTICSLFLNAKYLQSFSRMDRQAEQPFRVVYTFIPFFLWFFHAVATLFRNLFFSFFGWRWRRRQQPSFAIQIKVLISFPFFHWSE